MNNGIVFLSICRLLPKLVRFIKSKTSDQVLTFAGDLKYLSTREAAFKVVQCLLDFTSCKLQ